MVSSGMLRRVTLVRTDFSEEISASFIRVTRISELVVPSSPIRVTLMKVALISSETSALTRATRRNIPEDTLLHSHRCENLKYYKNFVALSPESNYTDRTTAGDELTADFIG
jgi:hypothetical protein